MSNDDFLDSGDRNLDPSIADAQIQRSGTLDQKNSFHTGSEDLVLPTVHPESIELSSLPAQLSTVDQSTLKRNPNRDTPCPNPALTTEVHLLSDVETPGYELLELPILGGMGCVYKAWNCQLERTVALKLSRKDKTKNDSRDEEQDRKLRIEAANLARIDHPSIAACYGYGRFGRYSFFEMQWIEGITLADFIEHLFRHSLQSAFGEKELIPWMQDMVESLIYALVRGIHHQDLKPQNVMLTPKRMVKATTKLPSTPNEVKVFCQTHDVKIMDFGLARRSKESQSSKSLSGTPSYMAPEQILCKSIEPMHVDMYCLGGILYACLTGKSPNRSSIDGIKKAYDDQDVSEVCNRPNPRSLFSHVAPDIEAIALKCLSVSPSDRYETLDDLLNDIRAIPRNLPLNARPISPFERMLKYVRRHPYAVSIITLLILGLGTTAALAFQLSQSYKETQAARKSDRETFQRTIDAVAIMDNEFLTDEQLNQPANRELAIRFKSKLFDLYQLLNSRPHLEVEDRRKLAETSSRLATDQRERGDYELAVKFFASTLQQHEKLLENNSENENDKANRVSTLIDLNYVKSMLSRDLYPADNLLKESLRAIDLAEALGNEAVRLNALTSFGSINYAIDGRTGAVRVADLTTKTINEAFEFKPSSTKEKIAKARALYRLGYLAYKGRCGRHPACYEESISIYEELMADSANQSMRLGREFAVLLSSYTMTLTNQYCTELGKPQRSEADRAENERLKGKIEYNYLRALSLLDEAQRNDPLNNLILRSQISLHWNFADFYHQVTYHEPSDAPIQAEEHHRNQCIAKCKELFNRQPQSAWAIQTMALHLFRLAVCKQVQGDRKAVRSILLRMMEIHDWEAVVQFELLDKIRLVHFLLELLAEDEEFEIQSFELLEIVVEKALKQCIDAGYSPAKQFTVNKLKPISVKALENRDPPMHACLRNCELLRRMLNYRSQQYDEH